jgi:hypothetical protein
VDGGKNWNETALTAVLRNMSGRNGVISGRIHRQEAHAARSRDGLCRNMRDLASSGILGDEFPDGTSAIHSITVEIRET